MMQVTNNKIIQMPVSLVQPEALKEVMDTMNTAQSGSATKESVIDAMVALSELLNLVQESTAKAQSVHSQDNLSISQNIAKQMQNNLTAVIADIQREQEIQASESFWQRLLNIVCAVVGFVLTAIGLPELGLPLLVTSVMNLTGLTQEITKGISELLVKMGVSQQAANMIADLIVMVAVIAVSASSSMGEFADGVSLMKKLATVGLKSLAALGEGLSSAPQLFSDIAILALSNSHMSEAEKKKLESELSLIQAILGAVLALVGAVGSSFKSIESACVKDTTPMAKMSKALSTKFSKMFGNLESLEERCPTLARVLKQVQSKRQSVAQTMLDIGFNPARLNMTGQAVSAGFGAVQGGCRMKFDKMQINAVLDLGEVQAMQDLLSSSMKQADTATKTDLKDFEQRLRTQSQAMASILGAVASEGRAIAQAYSA